MNEETKDALRTTAEAIRKLALRGEEAVQNEELDVATTLYTLANEMTYSMATALRVAASNRVKQSVIPEDKLNVEYTGAENPLTESPGNYL